MATASEVEAVVRSAVSWAGTQPDIVGVALVGSWARGTAHSRSDIDLIFLTNDRDARRSSIRWLKLFLRVNYLPNLVKFTDRTYGAVWSRQSTLRSGLEIEFTFAHQSWASLSPIDPGTQQVVMGGFRPLYDPFNLLVQLSSAVIA